VVVTVIPAELVVVSTVPVGVPVIMVVVMVEPAELVVVITTPPAPAPVIVLFWVRVVTTVMPAELVPVRTTTPPALPVVIVEFWVTVVTTVMPAELVPVRTTTPPAPVAVADELAVPAWVPPMVRVSVVAEEPTVVVIVTKTAEVSTAPRVVVTAMPAELVPVLMTKVLVPAVCVAVTVATDPLAALAAQNWVPKEMTVPASAAEQDSMLQSRTP